MIAVSCQVERGTRTAQVAMARLVKQIDHAMTRVHAAPTAMRADEIADPLGPDGRRALAAIADLPAERAVQDWLRAHTDFWAACGQLATLAADDPLRGGRHQIVYDAGLRWRRQVVVQRRGALLGAARTARRALHQGRTVAAVTPADRS